MESRVEAFIVSAVVASVQFYHMHHLHKPVPNSISSAILYGLAALGLFFIFYLWRSNNLPDKTRELSYRQKCKVTEYLKLYGATGEKSVLPGGPLVALSYQSGVRDAGCLGASIKSVLEEAGWPVQVEDENLLGEPEHGIGLWLYGEGAFEERNGLIGDLLQDAFRGAGIILHSDVEYPSMKGEIHIVVGAQEDRCLFSVRKRLNPSPASRGARA